MSSERTQTEMNPSVEVLLLTGSMRKVLLFLFASLLKKMELVSWKKTLPTGGTRKKQITEDLILLHSIHKVESFGFQKEIALC